MARSLPEIYEDLKSRRRGGQLPAKWDGTATTLIDDLAPLVDELAALAHQHGLDTLGYLLDKAREEVQRAARHHERGDTSREALVVVKRLFAGSELARWLEVHALAHRAFGNPKKAEAWLSRPNPSFGGQAPSALLSDELGAAVVRETLEQIDHGIFA